MRSHGPPTATAAQGHVFNAPFIEADTEAIDVTSEEVAELDSDPGPPRPKALTPLPLLTRRPSGSRSAIHGCRPRSWGAD